MSVLPLFISFALTSTGEIPGMSAFSSGRPTNGLFDPPNFCITSAAEPETIGAAPEVPPKGPSPVPVPASAETDAPGAPISGLSAACSSGADRGTTIRPSDRRGEARWPG